MSVLEVVPGPAGGPPPLRPPAPRPAGPRHRRPPVAPWRRSAVLGVLAVLGAAAGTGLHLDLRGELAAARSERAAVDAEVAALGARAAGVEADNAERTAGAARAEEADVDVRALTAELAGRAERARAAADALAVDAGDVGARVATVGGELAGLRARLDLHAAQTADLRSCTGGVSAATALLRAQGAGAAVGTLRDVSAACARALTSTGASPAGAVFPYDFPDPSVVRAGDGYVAYATNATGGAVQVLRSPDLATWTFVGGALPVVPGWARPGATWAPSATFVGDRWLLYYTVRERVTGRQCISVAGSPDPEGPFLDGSRGPLVCDLGEGGSIDPSPFRAPDGSLHLLWKNEGEVVGRRAELRSQPLRPDGLALEGTAARLIAPAFPWEGRTVEAPSMVASGGSFLLLYSANRWDTGDYAVGAARCAGPQGPCTRQRTPVLATGPAGVGPGGAEAFLAADGTPHVAWHAWAGANVGYPHPRFLHVAPLRADATSVTIG